MKKKQKSFFLLGIIAFIIFFIAGIYITYPLILHLGDYATGLGDELLLAWIQNWDIHAFFTHPLSLFNANIYFPYPNTLAYSDAFLTGSLLTSLPIYLIGQPIVANNSMLIGSLVLLGFSIYLLAYYLTRDFLASMFAGLLVVFSPATLGYYIHLQVLGIAWVPLSILFFFIFLNTKKTKYFALSLFFFLMQYYNSFLPGFFILFSIIIIIIFKFFENRKHVLLQINKKNIFLLLITFLLLIPIALPYYQVSREFHYVRDIRDAIHLAMQPEDLFYSSGFSRLAPILNRLPFNKTSQNSEFKPGYL